MSSCAPLVKCNRSYTRSKICAGIPLSSATRSSNACRKSSSPFIARAIGDHLFIDERGIDIHHKQARHAESG